MLTGSKLVVLDRDGVINHDSATFIKNVDEWIAIDRSIEAIVNLKKAGFLVAVATNQSGLARELFGLEDLMYMNQKLNALLEHQGVALDAFVFCPHLPKHECYCRKPKPGMLDQISKKLDVPLARQWLVGDSLRDLEAGVSRDMHPILVRTGKGATTEHKAELPQNTRVFDDLKAAADYLIASPDFVD